MYTIYKLTDPRDKQVRYVGCTLTPLSRRLNNHLLEARTQRHRLKNIWINELRDRGLRPEIAALCHCAHSGLSRFLEVFFSAYFAEQGSELLNRDNFSHKKKEVAREAARRYAGSELTKVELGQLSDCYFRNLAPPMQKERYLKSLQDS